MQENNQLQTQENVEDIPTIYWHDYETWGASPQKDRPSQFAGIRTDYNLNIIGEPLIEYCKPAPDYLPHPEACLITGITPQHALKHGLVEAEFMAKIHAEFSRPNTCVAGYNSIRFDDEVTRYSLYRNFYDPYEREWQNGNSRWDIIDLVRACYALRPEGVEWPENDEGFISFKLEHLTAANGLSHESAHDALSDVYATIALAKLIKDKQPRLFEYAFSLKNKHTVSQQLDLSKPSVVLHISSKLPAAQGCCTWVMPIAKHPTNANAVIAIDLSKSVDSIINDTPDTLREKLYAPREAFDNPSERPGVKLIHINRSPFLTTAKAMTEENAERLGLDRETCLDNYRLLAATPDIAQKLYQLYDTEHVEHDEDIDQALYSGGFLSDDDRRWCDRVIDAAPETLALLAGETQHTGLRSLLFRYRARNFPNTLTHDEMILEASLEAPEKRIGKTL